MEILHVERFRVDCRARGPGEPFSSFRPGSDPPDFLVRMADPTSDEVGLECTRFAIEERLAAQAQMERIEHALMEAPRERRARISGCSVRVRFQDPATSLSMPFKSGDDRLKEIVKVVLDLDPMSTQLPDSPLPKQLPTKVSTSTTSKTANASITKLGRDHSPSRFMSRSGFELVLDFTTTHTAKSVCDAGAKAIEKKMFPTTPSCSSWSVDRTDKALFTRPRRCWRNFCWTASRYCRSIPHISARSSFTDGL
jgi:hypothetical protein